MMPAVTLVTTSDIEYSDGDDDVKVSVIADVCFDFLRDLNLHTVHQDVVLSLTNSVLAEHVADNQVCHRIMLHSRVPRRPPQRRRRRRRRRADYSSAAAAAAAFGGVSS